MNERSSVWSEVVSRASSVKVRNVMNPLLWLNAVALPPLLIVAVIFRDQPWLSGPVLFGCLIIPGWTLWEYSRFARREPQRLHSEEYLIEQQRLMIESKNSGDPVDVAVLPSGENPELSNHQGRQVPFVYSGPISPVEDQDQ